MFILKISATTAYSVGKRGTFDEVVRTGLVDSHSLYRCSFPMTVQGKILVLR